MENQVLSNSNNGRVMTNSVRFQFLKPHEIFKYIVTFSPELPSPTRRGLALQQFLQLLREQFLFDDIRNALYLPFDIETIVPKLKSDDQVFSLTGRAPYSEEVEIQLTFSPVQFFEEAFMTVGRGFELLGFEKYSDGFYDTVVDFPQHKLQIHSGIRFGTRKNDDEQMMLWFQLSSLVWRQNTVLDALSPFALTEDHMRTFEEFIKSKFILNPQRALLYFKVQGIRWDLNPSSTFHCYGAELTFADYYRLHYGIEVKDLIQPLLLHKCPASWKMHQIYQCRDPMIVNESQNFIVHIPELCRLSGISMECKKRKGKSMENEILKYLVVSPQKTVTTMNVYLKLIHSSELVTKLFEDWGIELDSSFVEVVSSVLRGPRIKMNGSTPLGFDSPDPDTLLTAHLEIKRLAGSIPVCSSPPLLCWILVSTAADEKLAIKFRDAFTNEIAKLKLEHPGVKSYSNGEV